MSVKPRGEVFFDKKRDGCIPDKVSGRTGERKPCMSLLRYVIWRRVMPSRPLKYYTGLVQL